MIQVRTKAATMTKPGLVDVEVSHEGPEAAAEVIFPSYEAEELNGADEERDEDGKAGDGEVVVDLADRPGKGHS